MGGTTRRLVLGFVLATAIYALPVVESTAAPTAPDSAPRLVASGHLGWVSYTPDGSHVIVGESGMLTAFPVAGGPGVNLGSGYGVVPLNRPSEVLIRDADSLYLASTTTGSRRPLAHGVGTTVMTTGDGRWVVAAVGARFVKIDVTRGIVEEIPDVPQLPRRIPGLDTVANEVMYLAPLPDDELELRGYSLDSGIDRSIGPVHFSAEEEWDLRVASQQRMVVFVYDSGGHGAGYRYYTIDPWELVHAGAHGSVHLTADGKTLLTTYWSPSGSDVYGIDLDSGAVVHFGKSLDGGLGAALHVSSDERFAASTMSDPDERTAVAYVYDVTNHTSRGLGELTVAAGGFVGAEPRLLIDYYDEASYRPIGRFSVTVTGADPRAWPAHVGRIALSVGDVVYTVDDGVGIYRLNADGSNPVLVSNPTVDGGELDWSGPELSPTGDTILYTTTKGNQRSVWLLRVSPEYEPCGGTHVITGTPGDDEIVGTDDDDVIKGLGGNDVIDGKGGNDYICGDDGDDELIGGDGKDVIFAGSGADRVRGGRGSDVIHGDSGSDDLVGGRGRDFIYGGDGPDFIRGRGGPDWIRGGTGHDDISGGGGADTIWGDEGDDLIDGNAGRDNISSVAGNNVINGGIGNDTLNGGSGDDVIRGGDGDDTLSTESGINRLEGGNGNDDISFFRSSGIALGGPGDDYFTWVTLPIVDPPLIWGGAGNDRIGSYFGGSCNVVRGGSGDDRIECASGVGTLIGGNGSDYLIGGFMQSGGSGADRLTRATIQVGGTGDDELTQAITQYGRKGNDTLSNFETGYGGHGADTLHGDTRANVLYGGAGDDALFGNGGDDRLFGGPGADTLDGGDGNDTCTDEGITTPC